MEGIEFTIKLTTDSYNERVVYSRLNPVDMPKEITIIATDHYEEYIGYAIHSKSKQIGEWIYILKEKVKCQLPPK